ncbi:CaiB/BaiF CoA-transferase family protein [Streptomyces sp. NPDC006355]|uniref:CaiB/BaiF CoA transferase family protein n=1 Tax=Streptomyces sp. NPDC006355 TaxID=3156758 RepID=UPI0033B6BD38
MKPESSARPDPANLPLQGLRVVEQGSFITGPLTSLLLGDMGADVIKVERPGTGDIFRSYDGTLYAPTFRSVNRNKRSITLDTRDTEDRAVFDELIESADVYVHNFRPGVADRLGVGSERLRALNPELVYCAISGLGSTGPYAARPAYDTVAQAYSGMLSLTLDRSDPRISGPAVADSVTGLYAAQGILAALVQRGIRGGGKLVEISMIEAMAHFLAEPYSSFFGTGENPGPYGRAAVSQSYAMRCSDDRLIALHLSSPPKFWLGLIAAVGLPELAEDPRFKAHAGRIANYEELRTILQAAFSKRPRDEWLVELSSEDVPHAPVLEPSEAIQDPQFQHLKVIISALHPTEGLVEHIRPPHRFDGTTATQMLAPPTLGEHNDEIRRELAERRRGKGRADGTQTTAE